jgi:hypothetical protein
MPTDIRLDEEGGDWVIVQSNVLKLTASDVILDAPSRRLSHGGFRRALVHDGSDGLTINFARDYPGGVRVEGDLTVTGRLRMTATDSTGLEDLETLRRTVLELQIQLAQLGPNRIAELEDRITALSEMIGASFVPPWQTLEEVERGDDMGVLYKSAEALGFVVEFIFLQNEPGFEHEQVVRIEPQPGTLLPRGSTVRISLNLHG